MIFLIIYNTKVVFFFVVKNHCCILWPLYNVQFFHLLFSLVFPPLHSHFPSLLSNTLIDWRISLLYTSLSTLFSLLYDPHRHRISLLCIVVTLLPSSAQLPRVITYFTMPTVLLSKSFQSIDKCIPTSSPFYICSLYLRNHQSSSI